MGRGLFLRSLPITETRGEGCTQDSEGRAQNNCAQKRRPSGTRPRPPRRSLWDPPPPPPPPPPGSWGFPGRAAPSPSRPRCQHPRLPGASGYSAAPRPRSGYRPPRALTSRVSASASASRSGIQIRPHRNLGSDRAVRRPGPLTPPGRAARPAPGPPPASPASGRGPRLGPQRRREPETVVDAWRATERERRRAGDGETDRWRDGEKAADRDSERDIGDTKA